MMTLIHLLYFHFWPSSTQSIVGNWFELVHWFANSWTMSMNVSLASVFYQCVLGFSGLLSVYTFRRRHPAGLCTLGCCKGCAVCARLKARFTKHHTSHNHLCPYLNWFKNTFQASGRDKVTMSLLLVWNFSASRKSINSMYVYAEAMRHRVYAMPILCCRLKALKAAAPGFLQCVKDNMKQDACINITSLSEDLVRGFREAQHKSTAMTVGESAKDPA